MTKATQSTIHMSALDGEYQPDNTIMRGAPDDVLALICTAIHIYMKGSDRRWKRVANKVIRDVVYEETTGKSRNPNDDRLLGALLFAAGCFALFGLICFVGLIVNKIAGLLP